MRMVKIQETEETLGEVIKKFLLVKEAQHTGELTMDKYRKTLSKFVAASHDSVEYSMLESDVLSFLAAIPDTSPARYNLPFQNINALLNWMVEQEKIPRNPIKVHKLHKRRDDGNIKPIDVERLRKFITELDRKSYTGLRDYTIIMVMLDTGIRTRELLSLREGHYSRESKSLVIEKVTAKTRRQRIAYLSNNTAMAVNAFIKVKPPEWEDWLFPNYEGKQLKVDHLDKSFAKHSEKSGIKVTPYQLRHSFATLFLKGGGDLFSLQRLMGHSDLRMTKRYTELDENFIQEQHKAFSPINLLTEKKSNRVVRIQ